MWQQFDVNVMVNGNKCKQYDFQGRKYIEAKDGSEWYFQIQNNSSKRVLAVCSVDGLNVLTGEKAGPNDSGYIIDSYHSQKIKGFRFSDDEWALFKFGYKFRGKTYAQSKEDGSEKNCGVIGVKLFYEKPKVIKYKQQPCQYPSYAVTGSAFGNVSWSPGGQFSASSRFDMGGILEDYYVPVRENDLQAYHGNTAQYCAGTPSIKFRQCIEVKKNKSSKSTNFNMGTEWGKRETSKVQIVDFERGCEAYSIDIFYASRSSLIDMGIPLGNELKVCFPESFPNRYAKPPKHWNG